MLARSSWASCAAYAFLGLLVACGGAAPTASSESPKVSPEVIQALAAGEPQSLIVQLDENALAELAPEAFRPAAEVASPEELQAQADARSSAYSSAQSRVAAALTDDLAVVRHAYSHLPTMHVEVKSPEGLARLLALPEVLRLDVEGARRPLVDANLALIDQPAAAAAGDTGRGTTVAVLDTGANYTLPVFGPCTTVGKPAGTCRVVYETSVAPTTSLDPNGHGTNVSAIVATVAPAANLVIFDVFRGSYAYDSDILTAIDWCIANRATYNIVSLNMSLGGGDSTTPCSQDPLAPAIAEARAAGILSAIAAGNDGAVNAISAPGCAPGAVSVGAVYAASYGGIAYSSCTDFTTAADQITCFSNSASFLSVLAPGALITAGGYTMAGTSQATPHVAAAIAILRAAFPGDTVSQTVTRLQSTGVPIEDPRNGVTTPRIDLGAATGACSLQVGTSALSFQSTGGKSSVPVSVASGCSWKAAGPSWLSLSPSSGTGPAAVVVTAAANYGAARTGSITVGGKSVTAQQAADTTPPTGSVAIDGGQKFTNSTAATLALSAADPAGVTGMCLSSSSTCSAWVAFAPTKAWPLSSTPGTQTVYAWFKDQDGNVSARTSASIVLDQAPPTGGTLSATPSKGAVALSWGGFSDALSGVASYTLVYAKGSAPASCSTGTRLYSGTGTTFTQTGLASGTSYGYRVCATDGAGNTSAGVTKTAATP